MMRFMGLMPSSEIEMSKTYKDENGLTITVDAGPHGWTIIYADHSTQYEDVDDTTVNNFNTAYNILCEEFKNLVEIFDDNPEEECDECSEC